MEFFDKNELKNVLDDSIAHFVHRERRLWNNALDRGTDFDRTAVFHVVTREMRVHFGPNLPAYVDGKTLELYNHSNTSI